MKLIKLHYMRSSENEKHGGTVYINPDHIVSISEYGEGSCVQTVTDIEDGRAYYVQETPEQIIKIIEAAKEYPPLRLEGLKIGSPIKWHSVVDGDLPSENMEVLNDNGVRVVRINGHWRYVNGDVWEDDAHLDHWCEIPKFLSSEVF